MTLLQKMLAQLTAFCADHAVPAWLVGGAARDLERGHAPTDLDLAVAGDGLALARAFADTIGGAFVALDVERLTGRAVLPGEQIIVVDFATLRAPTIEGDLGLRDFTVNAFGLPIAAAAAGDVTAFIDPTGGRADLRARVLRAAGPTSLADDPLRVLRAARLAASLELRIAPELPAAMAAAAPGLAGIAVERVRDELLKLLDARAAAPALRLLANVGALFEIIPELKASAEYGPRNMFYSTILEHLLETVASLDWLVVSITEGQTGVARMAPYQLPVAVRLHPELNGPLPFEERLAELLGERRPGGHRRSALLKFAALLHDIAKPQTAEEHPDGTVTFYGHQELGAEVAGTIARRLKCSRADTIYLRTVIQEHMRPGQLRTSEVITLRAVARFFRDANGAGPDVLLHELGDHMATRGDKTSHKGWAAHLAFVEAMLGEHYAPPPERVVPLLDGRGLMEALDLTPGPIVGALLREIAEAQAAGEIGTRDEAIVLARDRLAARQASSQQTPP